MPKGEAEWLKAYHPRMRPRQLAHIPSSLFVKSFFLAVLGRSSFRASRTIRCLLRLRGISGTGDKAETSAETFDSYSQHPFVLRPMRADFPQKTPSLGFSTILKMDIPPFLTVVLQSLNRISCVDTEEAQPRRFKFDASGNLSNQITARAYRLATGAQVLPIAPRHPLL